MCDVFHLMQHGGGGGGGGGGNVDLWVYTYSCTCYAEHTNDCIMSCQLQLF